MESTIRGTWLPEHPRHESDDRKPRRRVVVTGIGVIAPSGIGIDALWDVLRRGESTITPITRFDVSEYPVRIAAQVPDFRPRQFMTALKARTASRFCHLTFAASRLAVDNGRVAAAQLDTVRTGFFLGTSVGRPRWARTRARRSAITGHAGCIAPCPSPHRRTRRRPWPQRNSASQDRSSP